MRLAAIQHNIVWENPSANFERLEPLIGRAASDGARVVVLSEMFSTGFSLAAATLAEPLDGPSVSFLAETASRHDVWMIATLAALDGAGVARNLAVAVAPDGSVMAAPKLHPFTFDREHEAFTPGDEPLCVVVDGVRFSVLVCYDLRFAPAFWKLASTTDCYVVPANWPEARRAHWSALLVARAIENEAYCVGVNRVGTNVAGVAYSGDSSIVSPLGEPLCVARNGEAILMADIDPGVVADVRRRFPFLSDRRSELGE